MTMSDDEKQERFMERLTYGDILPIIKSYNIPHRLSYVYFADPDDYLVTKFRVLRVKCLHEGHEDDEDFSMVNNKIEEWQEFASPEEYHLACQQLRAKGHEVVTMSDESFEEHHLESSHESMLHCHRCQKGTLNPISLMERLMKEPASSEDRLNCLSDLLGIPPGERYF